MSGPVVRRGSSSSLITLGGNVLRPGVRTPEGRMAARVLRKRDLRKLRAEIKKQRLAG